MRRRVMPLVLAIGFLLGSQEALAGQDGGESPSDRFTSADRLPSDVASVWFDTLYDVIRREATAPGSRANRSLTSGSDRFPKGHPRFDTDAQSRFLAAALEVYRTGQNLTDEQKTIASYWADSAGATGTPPGHWIAIVGQLARNDDLSLTEAAEAYARAGIAVADAFVACWSAKYVFNLQRPVTYIGDHIDATWLPFIVTPPFPSYTSGHSSQSGAAARVLTAMFGVKAFTDTLHVDHDLVPTQRPRSFHSFDEAAAEAAVSRLYGGIHYAFDNNDGLKTGRCVGQAIVDRVNFRRR